MKRSQFSFKFHVKQLAIFSSVAVICLFSSFCLAGEKQALTPEAGSDIPAGFGIGDGDGVSLPDDVMERLFWDKMPLSITLPVGAERTVTFPGEVRVGIPAGLSGKLRTQSINGTVYWLATEPFETQRVEIHETNGGGIFLVDLSASKDPGLPANPIEVLNKQPRVDVVENDIAGNKKRKPPKTPGLVTLTRYAAQQLYAPARLLKAVPGIHRVVVTSHTIDNLIQGESIEATPVASWQAGKLYVTAVQLRNTGYYPVVLDPRRIRGGWKAATFQHVRLQHYGSEADTTAVYLVSDRPFHEMIREVI